MTTLEDISRLANMLTGGSQSEMLCTRAYNNGWAWFVCPMDRIHVWAGGKDMHCRRCAAWDKRNRRA